MRYREYPEAMLNKVDQEVQNRIENIAAQMRELEEEMDQYQECQEEIAEEWEHREYILNTYER